MSPNYRIPFLCCAIALSAVSGACSDASVVAPAMALDSVSDSLSSGITLEQVRTRAGAAPVRLEIEVRAGGPPWMAREVEIENDDSDDEKIESRVVSADAASGTIRLAFGGLEVDLSSAGRFRVEGVGDVSRVSLLARVEAALSAGRQPGIELRRRIPSVPQSPDDPSFVPRDVRLDDDAKWGELEVLVDGRHIATDSETRGRITVFGVDIVVDRTLGTGVRERNRDFDGAVEIEGLVDTVDPAAGVVGLKGGPFVRTVEGTRFHDGGDRLTSLGQVSDALRAGHLVEVEAEAVRTSDGSYIALKIEFEIEDDADDDVPGAFEFEGEVVEVELGSATFRLADGRAFTLTDRTRVDAAGDVTTLAAVAGALGASLRVKAEGDVLPDATAPGGQRLISVKFETDGSSGGSGNDDGTGGAGGGGGSIEFDGGLVAVDAAAGTFTLQTGVVYTVTSDTRFEADGDLFSLAAAQAALAAGKTVRIEGDAVADATVSSGWRVLSMKIEVDD